LNNPNSLLQSVLVCLVPTDDPGVQFLPRIQSLPTTAGITMNQAVNLLTSEMLCQFVGSEQTASDDAVELARLSEIQPCVAVGTKDGSWMIVTSRVNEDSYSSDRLASHIAQLISGGPKEDALLRTHQLPPSVTRLGDFLRPLSLSTEPGLFVVHPPLAASDVFAYAANQHSMSEDSLRLSPGVPTGLVFASLEQ
jgi:hypothetical protein